MTSEEAKSLRRQKDGIQMMVFNCVKMNQDAKHLIIEYYRIVNKLIEDGQKVYIRSPYLKLDYWGLTPQDITSGSIIPQTKEQPIIEEPKQSKFILTLAWDNTVNNAYIISYIKEYLRLMSIELYDDEFTELPNKTEYTIKYVFYGTKEEFKILKKSTNIILDMFPERNKNNIVIFGKEMIY